LEINNDFIPTVQHSVARERVLYINFSRVWWDLIGPFLGFVVVLTHIPHHIFQLGIIEIGFASAVK
jgi:hypothetical protein